MKLLSADDHLDTKNMHKSKKNSLKLGPISTAHLSGGSSSSSSSSSSSGSTSSASDHDDSDSPPISPLRSPLFSPTSTSSPGWTFSSSQGSHHSSSSSPFRDMIDDDASNESHSSLCNSKDTYNTKFAKHHLETYRQNDRMRWNFDFDHNRPLDSDHHHHHQAVPRYQWEPAI